MRGLKKLLTGIVSGAMALSMVLSSGSAITAMAASHTITVDGAIKGEIYKLYKIFDYQPTSDETVGTYTIDADSEWYSFAQAQVTAGRITLNQKGTSDTYLVKWVGDVVNSETGNDDTAIAAFAKDAQAAISGKTVVATTTATDEGATFDVGDDYGYYLVSSTLGVIVGIDTSTPNATIKEKNKVPTTEKKVEENNGSEQKDPDNYGDKNDAEIGDTVNYLSFVYVPAPGVLNVKFEDVMTDSLDLIADSIKVDGDAVASSSVVKEYTTGDHSFTISFTDASTTNLNENKTFTIAYSAILNASAKVGLQQDLGEMGGNDNHSRITYGNGGESEWDWTRTYTYPIEIKKTDEADKPLSGAEFELTLKNVKKSVVLVTEGTKTTAAEYRMAVGSEDGATTTLVSPESGMIKVVGLDADTYVLTETKAPDNYNILDEPVTFVLDSNTNDAQGDDNTQQKAITLGVTNDGVITVINTEGVRLPSTGGIGTTIFYIVGALLICAAVVFMIMKRKGAQAE